MEGVEATGGGADGEEGAVEAMEEGDDDTISYVETGVGVAGATGAVEEGGLEALGVPSNAVDTVSTVGISVEIKSISRRPVVRDLLVDPHRSSRRRRTSRGATGSSPFTARARSTAGPSPSYQRFAGGRGRSRRSRARRRAGSSAACCTTTSCSRRTSQGASFGVSWPRPTPVRVLPLRNSRRSRSLRRSAASEQTVFPHPRLEAATKRARRGPFPSSRTIRSESLRSSRWSADGAASIPHSPV